MRLSGLVKPKPSNYPLSCNMRRAERQRLDLDIPNWTLIKDPNFTDCCQIDFGKRLIRYNPTLMWMRYAGTKRSPEVFVYPIREEKISKRDCKTCEKRGACSFFSGFCLKDNEGEKNEQTEF